MKRAAVAFLVVLLVVCIPAAILGARWSLAWIASARSSANAFEGPELLPGYSLLFGLRGPECFIEGPDGATLVPAGLRPDRAGVARIAVVNQTIAGEVADFETGRSLGYFLISKGGPVRQGMTASEFNEACRQLGWTTPPNFITPGELRP